MKPSTISDGFGCLRDLGVTTVEDVAITWNKCWDTGETVPRLAVRVPMEDWLAARAQGFLRIHGVDEVDGWRALSALRGGSA